MTISRLSLIASSVVIATGAFVGAASAQGLSGTASLDYNFVNSTSPDGSIGNAPGAYEVGNFGLDLDWAMANGYVLGTNIVVSGGSLYGIADAYNSGVQGDIRLGKDFGNNYAEIFYGYLDATGENNSDNGIRNFVGVAGSYVTSGGTTVTGQIGYMDTAGGTDDGGEDPIGDAVFASIGTLYEINSAYAVGFNLAGANGVMDDDNPRDEAAIVLDAQLSVHYTPSSIPALDLYATANYATYFQGGENDTIEDTSFGVGIAYNFGSGKRASAPALPLAKWVAITGGLLE